jgi:hypothetical protein
MSSGKTKKVNQNNLATSLFKNKVKEVIKSTELDLIMTENQREEQRCESIISSLPSSNVGELVKKFQPLTDFGLKIIDTVSPLLTKAMVMGNHVYAITPVDLSFAMLGLFLCFFGGHFAVTLAALEAFYASGYERCATNAQYLWTEYKILWKKSREDDNEDLDGDGTADVLQMSARQLLTRKIGFFFANCSDPTRMMDMFYGIINSLTAVIAVLKVDFARVIMLGNSIGENLRKVASYTVVPTISTILPNRYHQWIAPMMNFLCKAIAISIAWSIQSVISAVQSAIRGGLMASRRLLKFANNRGWVNLNENDTYADEYLGWALAAIGVYFQITRFFAIPFPLNMLLWPADVFETSMRWVIQEA